MENKQGKKLSKRQALRAERARQAKRQRILIISGILIFVIVILALVVSSSFSGVGEIISITPQAYPNENGVKVGDPNAKVVIDNFQDFKCSHCKSFTLQIEPFIISELVETGKVLYIFHNFPFLSETESLTAANGVMCAAEQNRLFDFKKLVFTNTQYIVGEFSTKKMNAFAKDLGLDANQFEKCMAEKRYQKDIEADVALGGQMGVTGTPSIFINGVLLEAPSLENIKAAVEAALNQ